MRNAHRFTFFVIVYIPKNVMEASVKRSSIKTSVAMPDANPKKSCVSRKAFFVAFAPIFAPLREILFARFGAVRLRCVWY